MWEEKYAAQDVLIALCCHNHFSLVPPLCVPVQGGARLNPAVEGAIPDIGAKGDISTKKPYILRIDRVVFYVEKPFCRILWALPLSAFFLF